MPSICIYFQIHQPNRLVDFSFFDIAKDTGISYFDVQLNQKILEKVSQKCYLPATKLINQLIEKHEGKFQCSYSISGITLDQLEQDQPSVIDLFQNLVNSNCVELLSETYYHSLASVFSQAEYEFQVELHQQKIQKLFGFKTQSFRNTELIYNNFISNTASKMGFKTILTEGILEYLTNNNPNIVYTNPEKNISVLTKNFSLSDDIAFRFSDKNDPFYPLTAQKFLEKIEKASTNAENINIFIDYETLGEHHWEDTGIFAFFESWIDLMIEKGYKFETPHSITSKTNLEKRPVLDITDYISWADTERDLSAWMGNSMQIETQLRLYKYQSQVMLLNDTEMIDQWRKLQTSDHFYYMSTKGAEDGSVHSYFSPYRSPYDAYINYMNVLSDFELKLNKKLKSKNIEQII